MDWRDGPSAAYIGSKTWPREAGLVNFIEGVDPPYSFLTAPLVPPRQ